jgi:hypothetical protein
VEDIREGFGRRFLRQTVRTDTLPKKVAEFGPEQIGHRELDVPIGESPEQCQCFFG